MFVLIKLFVIYLLSTQVFANISVINEEAFILQETIDFYTKVSNALIQRCSTVYAFNSESYHTTLISNKVIRLLSPCPVLIQDASEQKLTTNPCTKCARLPKHIFFFTNNINDMKEHLKNLKQSAFLNVQSYIYFVICHPIKNVLLLNQMLKQIWNNNILHFIVSYYYNRKFQAVTYNPFFDKIINLTNFKGEEIYHNKLSNMNGYQLRVGFFADPPRIVESNGKFYGIDAMIMMGFGKKVNATIKIVQPGYAQIIDEKYLKHFFQVIRKQIDFGFVSCFAIKDTELDTTYPRRMDGVVVLVQHSSTLPKFYYMFMMFDDLTWIFLGVSLLIVSACEYFQLKCLTVSTDFLKILIENWGTIFSMPFTTLQRLYSTRIILLLWITACITLNIHFQSLLTSELISSKFNPNMDTLEELKKNNTIIVINRGNVRGIPGHYPQKLVRSWSEHRILEKITNGDTSTAYAIQSSVAELISLKRTVEGYPVYHIVKELLIPGFTTYLFPKDSPYLDEVNRYILLDQQFGLSRLSYINYASVNSEKGRELKKIAVINLSHLQGAFYMLAGGIVISCITFILEILRHKN